jgi:hypothetical protein
MGLTHATVDSDGIANFHFKGRPMMSMQEARRAPQIDLGRRNFAEPRRYSYDPESELKDPTVQQKRLGLR